MKIKFAFADHVKTIMKQMEDSLEDNMEDAVRIVRNDVLTRLSGNRSGRRYRVPGTRRYYTASAPGQPPAQRLGQLRKTVAGRVARKRGELVGYVGTTSKYGRPLEYGTKRMAARPWLRPSFQNKASAIKKALGRRVM